MLGQNPLVPLARPAKDVTCAAKHDIAAVDCNSNEKRNKQNFVAVCIAAVQSWQPDDRVPPGQPQCILQANGVVE